MASGGTSVSAQGQLPGTASPVTAILQQLFGGNVKAAGGQFIPTAFGATGPNGPTGAVFTPEMFSGLTGLLQSRPATGVEQFLTGPDYQKLALGGALQSQDILSQGAAALPALLQTDPTAAIAQARRGFTQETLPAILERAPGFSSSDLQRELTRGGVDLETNVAALREQNLGRVAQTVQGLPAFAQALGTNLSDQASQLLGLGTLGREFLQDVSPAGDAFRTLSMLQSLFGGPGLTQRGIGSSQSKQGGVLS